MGCFVVLVASDPTSAVMLSPFGAEQSRRKLYAGDPGSFTGSGLDRMCRFVIIYACSPSKRRSDEHSKSKGCCMAGTLFSGVGIVIFGHAAQPSLLTFSST